MELSLILEAQELTTLNPWDGGRIGPAFVCVAHGRTVGASSQLQRGDLFWLVSRVKKEGSRGWTSAERAKRKEWGQDVRPREDGGSPGRSIDKGGTHASQGV